MEKSWNEIAVRTLLYSRVVIIMAFWSGTLYWAHVRPFGQQLFLVLFLGGAILTYFVMEAEALIAEQDPAFRNITLALFAGLTAVSLVMSGYVYLNYEELAFDRFSVVYTHEIVLVLGIIATVLAITFREFGVGFTSFICLSIVYGFFGELAPGVLEHRGISLSDFVLLSAMNLGGIYHNIVQVTAAWVALFILYAGLVQAYGGIGLALQSVGKLSRYFKSGVAQSAVVMSMIIGSVSGSASANTAITGSITIPMMKEEGLSGHYAAAIESVASTGGQVLPPIMGVAAFLMADFLGITYAEIVFVAFIPALIFYITASFSIKLIVSRELGDQRKSRELDIDPQRVVSDETDAEVLDGIDESVTDGPEISLDSKRDVVVQSTRFLLPFGVLLWTLIIEQYSVPVVGLYTVSAMVLTGTIFQLERGFSMDVVEDVVYQTYDGLERGARTMAALTAVVATIGIVLELFFATGVPSKIALGLLEFSGGVFLIAILLALLLSILLGFGMPTVAAYTLVAILIAPGLINTFDLPPMTVHFFVFYAAVVSNITPPIAFATVVASAIASANFWQTGIEAMKIGMALFILPIMFVWHPELITSPSVVYRLYIGGIVLAGLLILALGFHQRFPDFPTFWSVLIRCVFVVGGLAVMFSTDHTLNILLAVLLAAVAVGAYAVHGASLHVSKLMK